MRKQFLAMCVLSALTALSAFANDGDVKDAKKAMKHHGLNAACGVEANVGDSQPGGFLFLGRDRDIAVRGFGSHGYLWMTTCASTTVKDPVDKKKKSTSISCRGVYETEQTPDGKVCLLDKIAMTGLGDGDRPLNVKSKMTLSQARLENVPIFQECSLDYLEKNKNKLVDAVSFESCDGN